MTLIMNSELTSHRIIFRLGMRENFYQEKNVCFLCVLIIMFILKTDKNNVLCEQQCSIQLAKPVKSYSYDAT